MIGRVGRLPSMFHGGGDGERIVAFGRVGKPLKKGCFPAVWDLYRRPPPNGDTPPHATVFKATSGRAGDRGTSDMALGTKKRESRKSL